MWIVKLTDKQKAWLESFLANAKVNAIVDLRSSEDIARLWQSVFLAVAMAEKEGEDAIHNEGE